MLAFAGAVGDAVELVAADQFYRPAHQTVFDVLVDMFADGQPTGTVAVVAELAVRGLLAKVGGHDYLHTLEASATTAANTGHFARIVVDRATRRRLVEAGIAVQQLGLGPGTDADDLVDRAQAAVFAVSERRQNDTACTAADLLPDLLATLETPLDGLQGVRTGIAGLDALTQGMRPGQLWLIGARPSVGKSTLALGIAAHTTIRQKIPAAYFSLEMPAGDLMTRLLAAEAGVSLRSLQNHTLSDAEWERIAYRIGPIRQAPLTIDDATTMTVAEIRSKVRRAHQRDGLGLVVVDYVQLLAADGKSENRQQAVAAMSIGLNALAQDLGIVVIAVVQLNRGSEGRADRRPLSSDIRDSGQLEQDAFGIVLLHREDMHDATSARAGEVELIVDKNRGGLRDTTSAVFQGHYARIVDMPAEWSEKAV
ncbi:replicative DNA helicase [Frankia sp. AgW1.1]|nr:replicative DNA helicase [Frankia sp. AgW1.1]